MPSSLISDLQTRVPHADPDRMPAISGTASPFEHAARGAEETPRPDSPQPQPAYLARIATLPSTLPDRAETTAAAHPQRSETARLDQIEHALTILASVVARLAKEAQQSRQQLRSTELDPGLGEERRVHRELVRSMQARLNHLEERLERERQSPPPDATEQVTRSLLAIRDSLAALARRKQRPNPV